MTGFDGELYLRMLGERSLLDERLRHGPRFGSLNDAAAALLAVRAVGAATASRIVDDYEMAVALREPGWPHRFGHGGPPPYRPAGAPLDAARVAVCGQSVTQPWGVVTIRYVEFRPDQVTVGVAMRATGRRSPRSIGAMRFGIGPATQFHPRTVTVTDDRGTTQTAGFSGGGSDSEWTGRYHTHGPLAADTAYVEFLGERIDLPPVPPAEAVRLEPVPTGSPAATHLWSTLAVRSSEHWRGDLGATVDALVCCGALAADDPVIAQVDAVVAALGGRGGAAVPTSSGAGAGAARPGRSTHWATASTAASGRTPPLPAPWDALIAGLARSDGPTGLVGVGAVTPLFDGASIAVSVLDSAPDGFQIVATATGVPPDGPIQAVDPGAPRIVWWAADDRGGAYLGGWNGSSSDGVTTSGEIGFRPPLDPAARRVDIMPTGPTTRAVIPIPLRWGRDGAVGEER